MRMKTGIFSTVIIFFFSSRRRHTRSKRDRSSDVCSSDLLLALGAQAVREEREVDGGVAAAARRLLDVLELVDEDLLRVEEQPADQRRLPVVDRAARDRKSVV